MRRPAPIARVGSRFLQPSVGGHGTEGQSVRLEDMDERGRSPRADRRKKAKTVRHAGPRRSGET